MGGSDWTPGHSLSLIWEDERIGQSLQISLHSAVRRNSVVDMVEMM